MFAGRAYLEVVRQVILLATRSPGHLAGGLIRRRRLGVRAFLRAVLEGVPLRGWFVPGVGSHFGRACLEARDAANVRGWDGDRSGLGVGVGGVYKEERGDVMGHVRCCLVYAWDM
jgi:hypothetical protein